ncbi:MAG: elongation factor G [Candidatus Omnitrophota bacterium]|nr:MAG: elongation factor G [Candidatus Omnitrophota bacterium]
MDVKDIRNIVFLSHSSAGKTSLIDSILFAAKANTRRGSVNEGTSMCDYNPDEIERKITIDPKVLSIEKDTKRINLLDTPGYADFIGGVFSSLRAADCGLCLVCGVNGVEVGTSRVWDMLTEGGKPSFLFINKLDKEHSSFEKTIGAVQKEFGKNCVPITYPIGKETSFKEVVDLLNKAAVESISGDDKNKALKYRDQLIEAIAETDDVLIEKYLGGEELSEGEIINGLKKAVNTGNAHPVFCGSATKGIGVEELINAIIKFAPSSIDVTPTQAASPDGANPIDYKVSADEPFAAQVFKTVIDPYVGQLTVFRVFSGSLQSNTGFYNVNKSAKEKIGQIFLLKGKEQKGTDKVQAGDIAAVAKLKETSTGDTLCNESRQLKFDAIKMPEPAISLSLKPKTRQDEERIMTALSKLGSEDPTFKYGRDQQTKELIASGLGDLHLKIMIERLKRNFKVEVEVGTPRVAYKETIRKKVEVSYKHKKQTGGHGQYGEVYLKLEPLPRGENYEFVDKIVGGAIPRGYIPGVEKGVKATMQAGILIGAPVVGIKVTLFDGSFHTVDSSEMAFKIAASTAMRNGLKQASPVLLEPIMDVEVVVPEDAMGNITGDLNSRRGRIMGMEPKGANQIVKAQVPLAEMLKYATELRSITAGKGSYTMKFSRYEQAPDKVAQQIITQAKAAKEEAAK